MSGSTNCFADGDCLNGRICSGEGVCVDPKTRIQDFGHDQDTPDATTDMNSPDLSEDLSQGCTEDKDNDGFGVGEGCSELAVDCDDTDDRIYPSAPARCNGRDNDCDGEIDTEGCECTAGFMRPCGTDVGTCTPGVQRCVGGHWDACVGGVSPMAEACDGVDNNCNGTEDEGCPCPIDDTKSCGLDVGVCQKGTQTCVAGGWSECSGGVLASEEVCDGLDNDCDGAEDNNVVDAGNACGTGEVGICSLGNQVCESGGLVCQRVVDPRAEDCNNLDDNCNGDIDENVTQTCTTACGAGAQTCSAGSYGMCLPDNAPTEVCDGMDNNCDGNTDESFPEDGMSCDTGLGGLCGPGMRVCDPTGNLACEATVAPQPESCDGVDNDCDGLIDEDLQGMALTEECGTTCPNRSVRVCEQGSWSACDRGEAEVCNQSDSNCDTRVDNQAVCYWVCGAEVIVGTLSCGAMPVCELPGEICGDGIDNDCDGLTDQGCDNTLDDMVFVPGGSFYMGAATGDTAANSDEMPLHLAELDAYYLDAYEVSRSEYTSCVIGGGCTLLDFTCPLQPTVTQGDKAIVCVSHAQAASFCAWDSKRLPTEAEWEKAARGPFPRQVIWPWGNVDDATRGVFDCSASTNGCIEEVDTFAASASYYGNHHMAGHTAEWTSDFYSASFYTAGYAVNPELNVNQGFGHTMRGGSYRGTSEMARVSVRNWDLPTSEVGFRCAKDR